MVCTSPFSVCSLELAARAQHLPVLRAIWVGRVMQADVIASRLGRAMARRPTEPVTRSPHLPDVAQPHPGQLLRQPPSRGGRTGSPPRGRPVRVAVLLPVGDGAGERLESQQRALSTSCWSSRANASAVSSPRRTVAVATWAALISPDCHASTHTSRCSSLRAGSTRRRASPAGRGRPDLRRHGVLTPRAPTLGAAEPSRRRRHQASQLAAQRDDRVASAERFQARPTNPSITPANAATPRPTVDTLPDNDPGRLRPGALREARSQVVAADISPTWRRRVARSQ